MNGVGVTIKGSLFKYGLWKDGSKAIWLEGPWEMLKYVKQEQLQYVKFLMQNQKNLLEYIKKSIQ
jgi:maltose-binding protein MalE